MKKRISFLAFIFAIFLSALTISCILLIDAEPHEHTFDKTKWMSDEVCHWHAATCAHVYEEADRAEHSFDSGRITKEPTTTKTGEKTFVCSVCGYVYKEEIPVLDSDEDTPSGGGDAPNEGETPNEGDNTPNGGDTPNEGGSTPSKGGDTPSGGDAPNEGGDTPSEGGDAPSEDDNNTAGGEEDVDDEGVRNWNNYVANGWIVVKNGIVQPVAEENKAKIVGKITIPNSVTKIGNSAFIFCREITSVKFPDSVTEIGHGSFFKCDSITSVEIPASVTSIECGAFADCSNLANINVNVNNSAFISDDGILFNKDKTILMQCPASKTGNYIIPSSVKIINGNAFKGCELLESVKIPDSVTIIEGEAFIECNKLTSIEIPNSVTTIEPYTFGDCRELININVDVDNPSYTSENGILFNKDKTILEYFPVGRTGSYEIPSTVKTIGAYAFRGCMGLTNIKIPNSVTSIRQAFGGCTGLTDIEIPSSVISIEKDTFLYCTNLTSITFEDTANWYSSESEDSNQKTPIDVTNPSVNATELKSYDGAWCQTWLVKNPE